MMLSSSNKGTGSEKGDKVGEGEASQASTSAANPKGKTTPRTGASAKTLTHNKESAPSHSPPTQQNDENPH